MSHVNLRRQEGFTIIELMVATAVFAMIMLVITAGVISFTRQYYKGVITSNTQTTARAIMSELAQAIQFGGTVTTGLTDGSSTQGFCVDGKHYSYVLGQQVSDRGMVGTHQAYHAFVVDNTVQSCDASDTPVVPGATAALTNGRRELLGDRMRLASFDVSSDDGQTYTIHLRILYGEDDVLTPNVSSGTFDWSANGGSVKCLPGLAASQYCAITDLTTKVQKRISN